MVRLQVYSHLQGRRLVAAGLSFFLIGMLCGFVSPFLSHSLMPLLYHLEIAVSGLALVILGLKWPFLAINEPWRSRLLNLFIYGILAKWLATLAFVLWGDSHAHGAAGDAPSINASLWFLTLTLLAVGAVLIYGLRRNAPLGAAYAKVSGRHVH